MTIREYLDENSMLQAMPVIDKDKTRLPGVVGIIGFESDEHRESAYLEIDELTDSNPVMVLFAATGQNILEVVPFDVATEICGHPAAITDSEAMFFELGRLYFYGILVF